MWSGDRLTKIQATTRLNHLWPKILSSMSKTAQRKEKQQWAIEEPKFDNTQKLRVTYFVDPDDNEFEGKYFFFLKKKKKRTEKL